jgi:hypothetical protein
VRLNYFSTIKLHIYYNKGVVSSQRKFSIAIPLLQLEQISDVALKILAEASHSFVGRNPFCQQSSHWSKTLSQAKAAA